MRRLLAALSAPAAPALVAVIAAMLTAAAPALAAEDTARVPQLTASGEGLVEVVPDIAVVTLGVVTRGRTAADALTANSTGMTAIIAELKGAGIDEKDIGTSGFSVSPLYPPERNDAAAEPKIIGYAVSNQLRVTIRDLAASGALLDKVVNAGANQVNGISFEVADRVKPAEEALKRAVADARRKAEIMAAAAGVKLVRVLSVSADTGGGYYPTAAPMVKSMAVPVMPGQQAINQTATVVWEVAPE